MKNCDRGLENAALGPAAPRIATSGLVQRHSVFEWLSKHNRLIPEPIRFVKLDSEHAQSDGSP